MFIVILIAILSLYAGTNLYLCRTLIRWLGLSDGAAVGFGALYTLLASGYVLSNFLPANGLSRALSLTGGTFLAGYIFLLIALPLTQLVLRGKGGPAAALVILGLMALYMGVGIWMARSIRTTEYTVESPKGSGLRMAFISDLHIGEIIGAGQVAEMVDKINALDADYVFLGGDTFDSGPGAVGDLEAVGRELSRIESKQGVYAVFGNHDGAFRGQEPWAAELLERWGIRVLQDDILELPDLTLIGRIDKGHPRKTAAELTAGLDRDRLIVMLDHQPFEIDEARDAGVDLLLCGHTHKGQVFPANLITHAMYKIDYGMLQEGPFTAIVSSGAGTWGPRMRIGSVCEVVGITVE